MNELKVMMKKAKRKVTKFLQKEDKWKFSEKKRIEHNVTSALFLNEFYDSLVSKKLLLTLFRLVAFAQDVEKNWALSSTIFVMWLWKKPTVYWFSFLLCEEDGITKRIWF